MEFSVNSPVLFVLAGIIILIVLLQSVFFLLKALKRAREIGMEKSMLRKTIRTAAIFTIMPAVAIVVSVMTLSKDLGLPLPWLRLSVVGSLSYETIAASNAESAMGLVFGSGTALNASEYVTIALVMTASILVGIWLVPLVCKRQLGGMLKMEAKDKKWSELFQSSLFIGMISAFVGYVFCDVAGVGGGNLSGLIPVFVFFVSAIVMAVAGILSKKTGWRGITDYALPASLILGMASAIPLTAWLS